MVDFLKAAILGIVQGLSEFLPISSSGHLVIFSKILDFHEEGIAFEVFVHFGTLIAVLIAFRKEIKLMLQAPYKIWIKKIKDEQLEMFLRWDYYVIIATIPAVIIGLFFKSPIEALFDSTLNVFYMLIVTAFLMITTRFLKFRNVQFNTTNSFLIGIAQAFAILPGISRSGSTIFTGMALGIDRENVAKFSFIMSIPAILGAVVLQISDLTQAPFNLHNTIRLAIGTVSALISGYAAIIWLLDVVKKGKLQWFGYYCLVIAAMGLIWYYLG